jgi:hypothetical protein
MIFEGLDFFKLPPSIIKTSFLKKGPWKLSIHWTQNNQKYQEEHRVIVP